MLIHKHSTIHERSLVLSTIMLKIKIKADGRVGKMKMYLDFIIQ